MINSAFTIKDLLETLFICWAPPVNSLEELENKYALEQCFIPRALWQTIKEKFVQARADQFSQQKHINEISFMLDFLSLKPKKEPVLQDFSTESSRTVAREALCTREAQKVLFDKIDHMMKEFFVQYEPMDEKEYSYLVDAVFNFVNKVVGNHSEPRPLFLVGPWGTGKTHFFSILKEWINKLLPGAIHTEEIKITSPGELEGSKSEPGLFLEILRKQLQSIKKRGALIFLDEATWLTNSPSMLDSAKRAFSDEKFSKLITNFFGAGDITFDMTPTLFLIASNEEIKEKALDSRFKVVHFPHPRKITLVSFAKEYLKETPKGEIMQTLSQAQQDEILVAIGRAIMACSRECQNYRAAKSIAESTSSMYLIRYGRAAEAEKTQKSIVTPAHEAVCELALKAAEKRKTEASASEVFPEETKKSQ